MLRAWHPSRAQHHTEWQILKTKARSEVLFAIFLHVVWYLGQQATLHGVSIWEWEIINLQHPKHPTSFNCLNICGTYVTTSRTGPISEKQTANKHTCQHCREQKGKCKHNNETHAIYFSISSKLIHTHKCFTIYSLCCHWVTLSGCGEDI